MQAKTFAIMISVILILFILDLIRRQKMTFRYAMFWISSSAAVLLLTLHYPLLASLARLAGFQITSNFIFFLAIVFFIVVCLLLSVYVNEQNNRTERLAQSVGILEHRIKTLQDQLNR